MGPRRNNDDADEEEEKATPPVEEEIALIPTPFFALRSLDLPGWKDTGIRLPRPRFFKLQHQAIVENFPFVGVVNPALLASSCHYTIPPLLYNSASMVLIEVNMSVAGREGDDRAVDDGGMAAMHIDDPAAADRNQIETLASVQQKLAALQVEMNVVSVTPQEQLASILPPPPPTAEELAAEAAAKQAAAAAQQAEADAAAKAAEAAKADAFGSKFTTTALSRRSRGAKSDESIKPGAPAAAGESADSAAVIELDTANGLPSSSLAALSLDPFTAPVASLSIAAEYDDEVSAELWLLQRQALSQINHNNFVRSYLDVRAHASGDWKSSLAQIEQKEQQDRDTEQLYEESFLLGMARAQREKKRAKYEQSEAGQINKIRHMSRVEERNNRHIQRLMKGMLVEVERRDKKRVLDERRSASAAQRAAKRDRRAAQEAQWKNKKDQETYRRCENTLDHIIKQIERAVEGRPKGSSSRHRKPRDPNAPKSSHKKKAPAELFCICRTPYDNDRVMIGCEVCKDWFHIKCVHLSESMVSQDRVPLLHPRNQRNQCVALHFSQSCSLPLPLCLFVSSGRVHRGLRVRCVFKEDGPCHHLLGQRQFHSTIHATMRSRKQEWGVCSPLSLFCPSSSRPVCRRKRARFVV
jgi:hypothetical protein